MVASRANNKSRARSLHHPVSLSVIGGWSIVGVWLWLGFVFVYFSEIVGTLLILIYVVGHSRH